MLARIRNHLSLKWNLSLASIPSENPFSLSPIFFACVLVFFHHAWGRGFFHDGYLYAALGKNAAVGGHWLVPYLSESQYRIFAEHPPFIFALEGIFFKIFGHNFLQARLFSGLWGLGCIMALSFFLKKEGRVSWGFLAGLFFVSLPFFLKKVRFPNLDIPLTFFSSLSLYFYYHALNFRIKAFRFWILSGVFFGFALLCKGPPALFVPLTIFLHLAFTQKLGETLKLPVPWLAFGLGLFIFSLWPILLTLNGRFDVFELWIQKQFFNTIVSARGKENFEPFAYVVHLLKYSAPWLIAVFFACFKFFKKKPLDPLFLLFFCWILSVLVPLSLMKWKYSHYILPLYPALAALAALPFENISLLAFRKITLIFRWLVVCATLIFLIFPIGTEERRNPELFKLVDILNHRKIRPKNWIVVEDAYEYWATCNLSSYLFDASPQNISAESVPSLINNKGSDGYLLFLKTQVEAGWNEKTRNSFQMTFQKVIEFPNKGFTVYSDMSLD